MTESSGLRKDRSQIGVAVVCSVLLASVGGFLLGFDLGYIGPILSFPGFQGSVNSGRPLSSPTQGFITAIFSLGAVLSSLPNVTKYFCDGFGRRRSIICGGLFFCLGAVAQATSFGIVQILIGRLLSGFSVGLLSNAVPLYQSEVAPADWRGTMGTTYQLSITLGIAVAFGVDHIVNPMDDLGWRKAILVQTIPGIILVIGSLWMPPSPRWLVFQGRTNEAMAVLWKLRQSEEAASAELREIVHSVHAVQDLGEVELIDMLSSAYARRLLLVGMWLMALQQLCGMNAFMYYGTLIFKTVDLSESAFNCVIGVVNVLATIPGILAIERYGRAKLLQWSGAAMTVACVVCAALGTAYISFPSNCDQHCSELASTTSQIAGPGIALASIGFVASYASGWGPVAWVYCAEIYPLQFRSMALGITTCTLWVANYMIAQFTPILFETYRFHTFFIFALFCACGTLFACWLPETKGVMLEDMPSLFEPALGVNLGVSPVCSIRPLHDPTTLMPGKTYASV